MKKEKETDVKNFETGAPEKRKGRVKFQKGNKLGVRFGEGQRINLEGRPKGGMSLMKQAMKVYEDSALEAALFLKEKALDPNMDAKMQFVWFKELNSRILGAAKGSAEDIINQLAQKLEGTVTLNRASLEATALGDAEGLVRELDNQGILERVIEKVRSQREESKSE